MHASEVLRPQCDVFRPVACFKFALVLFCPVRSARPMRVRRARPFHVGTIFQRSTGLEAENLVFLFCLCESASRAAARI